jgi:hypothetical protein
MKLFESDGVRTTDLIALKLDYRLCAFLVAFSRKNGTLISFMKSNLARWCLVWPVLAVAGFCLDGVAQPMIPVYPSTVTVQATMPLASEPGNNPAIFTFSRIDHTNSAVTVSFAIGGTASNGVDYATITNSISLAAGQISTNIIITPVNEPSATGYKTVVLTLPHYSGIVPLATPSFYVGSIDRAVAYIAYNYTNVPPTVSLVTPTNGSSFLSLPNIEIAANAFDSNGWVTAVEFLANNNILGVVSNHWLGSGLAEALTLRASHGSTVAVLPGNHPNRYQFVWTNVPPGDYALTAVARDNAGLQTASAAINIVVSTNLPMPMVRIVSPHPGAEFPDRAPLNIYAAAAEVGGVINTVEFLANGEILGVATNYLATEPFSQFHLRTQWLPYYFRWTNAPVGSNILTAVATDNNGTRAASAPVSINVSTNTLHFPPGR